MKLNPRNIAKLCKHLRDAGAHTVTVSADGSVTAHFPQPDTLFINNPVPYVHPTWWLHQPTFVNPDQWTYTYGDTFTIGGSGGTIDMGDPACVTVTTTADLTVDANSPAFTGFQASTLPPSHSVTFTPTA